MRDKRKKTLCLSLRNVDVSGLQLAKCQKWKLPLALFLSTPTLDCPPTTHVLSKVAKFPAWTITDAMDGVNEWLTNTGHIGGIL